MFGDNPIGVRIGSMVTGLLRGLILLAVFNLLASSAVASRQQSTCHGDADGNGSVDFGDITSVLSNWLADYEPSTGPGDANGDGVVNFLDVTTVLSHFGSSCENMVQLVVLGDSLSDVGRHHDLYRTPKHPYWSGRYSDGPVWVEYFADLIGVASSGVKNYAVGGAASDDENCCTPDAPGLLTELGELQADIESGDLRVDSQSLFVIWIGANDFEIWRESGEFEITGPEVLIAEATDNLAFAVEALADLGAKRVLVANLPDLGRTPRLTNSGDTDIANLASTGTVIFNAHLAWSMSQIEAERELDVILLDTYTLLNEVLDDPTAFGFLDASGPCFDSTSGAECSEPGAYVFWDDLHPTTAAHEVLAGFAVHALATGGMALPDPICESPGQIVEILTPHGQFTLADWVEVAGFVEAIAPPSAELLINGVPTLIDSDGYWSTDVALNPGRIDQPIVAELRIGERVLDRDRIVVFQGDSIRSGQTVQDAVVACLNSSAIPPIRDEIAYQLMDSSIVFNALNQSVPFILASNYSGTLQYEVTRDPITYSCHTVDAELHDGFVRIRFNIHDLRVNYFIHSWIDLPLISNPEVDCDGSMYAGAITAFMDVMILPSSSGAPGEVQFIPVSPLVFDIFSFYNDVSNCDFDDLAPYVDIDGWVEQQAGDIEQRLRDAIESSLGSNQLAIELERIIAGISISTTISSALGVQFEGDIAEIDISAGHFDVSFDTRISAVDPGKVGATYAPVNSQVQHTGLVPGSGQPYDFAASVAMSSLNQLLLTRSDHFLQPLEIQEIDLGAGPRPITSGLLSAIAPSLRLEDPTVPYKLRITPTLPPMLMDRSMDGCGDVDLFLGHLLIEFFDSNTQGAEPELALAVDLRGCASLGFNASTGSVTVQIDLADDSVENPVLVDNRICADELALARLMDILADSFTSSFSGQSIELDLPSLYGMNLSVLGIQEQSGYVSVFFDVGTGHGRPDLLISAIDMPDAIDVNFPFRIPFELKNDGRAPVNGGFWIGASISPDVLFMNGNDSPLAEYFFNFESVPLQPGESRWLSLENIQLTNALLMEQTIFVVADVSKNPGGAGLVCESTEAINLAGTTILTTTPDASVSGLQVPLNAVGGIGPRPYRVTVRRNNVGIDLMQIPVKVTIGNPVLTWAETMVSVPRGGEVLADVFVPTPLSFGNPGQSNTFQVKACANLLSDADRSNDCFDTSVDVAVPYWDIRFTIETAPSSARRCTSIGWRVRATNHGNAPSVGVCAITGIVQDSGEGDWSPTIGTVPISIPSLPAKGSSPIQISGYNIWCNAYTGRQYIKAEINYARPQGCPIDKIGAGNYTQKAIRIDP